MVYRRSFLALATAAALAIAAGCSKSSSGPVLRVGMDLSYPPFEMQDPSGRPDGVSVKMAEALAAHLGRRLEIVPMNFSGLIPALKTGTIDLIISSMTASDERRQSIAFSDPYAFTGLALLVGKDSGIRSVEDLKRPDAVVAVKTGTTGEIWASMHLPQAKRVVFEDPAACVMEVSHGRADAFLYDQLSVLNYSLRHPETTRGLLDPFVTQSWAIGLAKGNAGLERQVNAFLADFRAGGGFESLSEQYLSRERSQLEKAGIPFPLR